MAAAPPAKKARVELGACERNGCEDRGVKLCFRCGLAPICKAHALDAKSCHVCSVDVDLDGTEDTMYEHMMEIYSSLPTSERKRAYRAALKEALVRWVDASCDQVDTNNGYSSFEEEEEEDK